MQFSISKTILTVFASLLLSVTAVWASDKADAINKNSTGLAIKGYDAVAYFTVGKAVKGDPQIQYDWMGA